MVFDDAFLAAPGTRVYRVTLEKDGPPCSRQWVQVAQVEPGDGLFHVRNGLEGGHYGPSLELAFRIAHALDAPLDAVFQWQDR